MLSAKTLFLALILTIALSAYCRGKPGTAHMNTNPIWSGTPRLLNTSAYGKLYEIGDASNNMKLLHVYGNMYQMGLAQGILLKNELSQFMKELEQYVVAQTQDSLPDKVPKFMRKKTATKLINLALDLTYYATKPFTNNKYYEQLKGIADGSGASFAFMRRVHMIGEVTKGHCSMLGAWGTSTLNGETIQLRALDWDFDGPYRKYPLAVVYHPSSKKDGNRWINIGFMGWVGVLSGMSEQQMAISEIGVSYPDQTFGKESRVGNPFTFILRDVLQFDQTINETIARFKKDRRTCNLILGVGDGKAGYFRGFQYGHSVLNVVNDTVPLPQDNEWHPSIKDTVYWGMDWLCPSFTGRFSEILKDNHGTINAEAVVRILLPGLTSGNLQSVIYDLTNQTVHFAYGAVTAGNKTVNAYDRPYFKLSLPELFALKY